MERDIGGEGIIGIVFFRRIYEIVVFRGEVGFVLIS